MELAKHIEKLASVDLFKQGREKDRFVGRPFSLSYDGANLLVADAWKMRAKGIPQGTFLLAFYENEDKVAEALLLRAIEPCKLPTTDDTIRSMIEYFKDDLATTGTETKLDDFTRYEFSFSGLACRVLGTFYLDDDGRTRFGADVENFFAPHHYDVYKPHGKVLELIANYHDENERPGGETDVRIGVVRYSSSMRHHNASAAVPVYVSAQDFLGKRTALFGMTRTGKSNTVKKIIEASVELSRRAKEDLGTASSTATDFYQAFDKAGHPRFPVGQIIFDINGEYANANMQDEGTAIFELFADDTTRYSVLKKPGFKEMKVNFYKEIEVGFELICSRLRDTESGADYVSSFMAADLTKPDATDISATKRWERRVAAYQACLRKAGFAVPPGLKIKFSGRAEINNKVRTGGLDPSTGISVDEAIDWFEWVWDNYDDDPLFANYRNSKGREWADEDLKAILRFLTRKRTPGKSANVSGFLKLRGLAELHTATSETPFETEIIELLRKGKIVIVDLSQGNPEIQRLFSERICQKVFADAMNRFVNTRPNNFVQFYFEEAHNLFPKKDDKDLSQIYNRLAKEGAKLNLGIIYATQEVSSISANILKNTQNWFIAHLNNDDEVREIRKYYDFGDFADSLVRFSSNTDKGFVRMKTYSNPYVVPVQVDRFLAAAE